MDATGHKKYLLALALFTLFSCLATFVLNYVVDPLWHHGGNKITGRNFAFNERLSKINHYLKSPQSYDCIILGSSRTTLINEKLFADYRCFNLAFSAATAGELIEYARYINAVGRQPKFALIGVDGRNFWREREDSKSPVFIRELLEPPSMFQDYFNLTSLWWSIRTLLNDSPHSRYYQRNFEPGILPVPEFKPPACVTLSNSGLRYKPDTLSDYRSLRALWPGTRLVGYVPPIAAIELAPLYFDGTLADYTKVIYAAAAVFDEFYDFSLPSSVTADPSLSYDGDHYNLQVNQKIAAIVAGKLPSSGFGMAVTVTSQSVYQSQFQRAVNAYINTHKITIDPGPACLKTSEAR